MVNGRDLPNMSVIYCEDDLFALRIQLLKDYLSSIHLRIHIQPKWIAQCLGYLKTEAKSMIYAIIFEFSRYTKFDQLFQIQIPYLVH